MWEEISIAIAIISSILVILVLAKLFGVQKSMSEMNKKFDITTASVAAPATTEVQEEKKEEESSKEEEEETGMEGLGALFG